MVTPIKTIWSIKAEKDLKEIYNFYAEENKDYAIRIVELITNNATTITFKDQYQQDEILGLPFRRFFIKHWRIIYQPKNDEIHIIRVFDTRKNPNSIS